MLSIEPGFLTGGATDLSFYSFLHEYQNYSWAHDEWHV